jgi:hypothetical protein
MPNQVQGVFVASQPLLSAQSGPPVLLYRATSAVHSANGIWFTGAQSNPPAVLGMATADVVTSSTVLTAGGVAGDDEPAPVPQAANKKRSAKESAAKEIVTVSLFLFIFMSTFVDLLYEKRPRGDPNSNQCAIYYGSSQLTPGTWRMIR